MRGQGSEAGRDGRAGGAVVVHEQRVDATLAEGLQRCVGADGGVVVGELGAQPVGEGDLGRDMVGEQPDGTSSAIPSGEPVSISTA